MVSRIPLILACAWKCGTRPGELRQLHNSVRPSEIMALRQFSISYLSCFFFITYHCRHKAEDSLWVSRGRCESGCPWYTYAWVGSDQFLLPPTTTHAHIKVTPIFIDYSIFGHSTISYSSSLGKVWDLMISLLVDTYDICRAPAFHDTYIPSPLVTPNTVDEASHHFPVYWVYR